MFTGIIETTARIFSMEPQGENLSFWIECSLADQFKVDQSISHDGVCLTVEEVRENRYRVTAISETLQKTNLGTLSTGSVVNLERCMAIGGRLDGHIVQGHIDTVGTCSTIAERSGSWEYSFTIPSRFSHLIIEKGSIAVNGISLTVFNVTHNTFTVAVIPYTYEHTNIKGLQPGAIVNLEFDVIGKYVARMAELSNNTYL